MQRFRIIGRAYPERQSWWFSRRETAAHGDDGETQWRICAEMTASQFHASLELRKVPAGVSPMDAKVDLENVVRIVLDTIGLFHGSAVDCEVIHLETPDGDVLVLDSAFGGLDVDHTDEEFNAVATTAQFVRGLRLGLADFRLAIRVPHDTAFLAYRGLDGIRADIAAREGITSEGAAWERTRAVTSLDKKDLFELKSLADPRRHGGEARMTHADREVALHLLQRGLIEYAKWCGTNIPTIHTLLTSGTAPSRDIADL